MSPPRPPVLSVSAVARAPERAPAPPELPDEARESLRIAMIGLRGIPATYGGVERAVEELSAALAARGHRVTVFARRSYCDPSVRSHRGVEVVHLREINTKHLEAISHTAWAVVQVLRARRYDVIHFHATGPSLLSFVPRLAGIPTVATVQGLDWQRAKWGRFARNVLRVAARASAVFPSQTIVVSRELERHYREQFGTEPVYIPNGVDQAPVEPAPLEGLEPDRFILFLGRLVPEKNVHTLIESYRHVDTDLPLVIAGPGSHSPDYVARLETLAASDPRVRLLGPCYGGAEGVAHAGGAGLRAAVQRRGPADRAARGARRRPVPDRQRHPREPRGGHDPGRAGRSPGARRRRRGARGRHRARDRPRGPRHRRAAGSASTCAARTTGS